jgi:hypothetical protein
MAAGSPPRALGRLVLKRVAVARPAAVTEPWPGGELPWSRTLWGEFMPERRHRSLPPPRGIERRRG